MSKHYEKNDLIWKAGVYLIYHTARPNRSYIGSTRNTFKSRWDQHLTDLRCDKHNNCKLQETVNSLGVGGIRMVCLQDCPPEWAYSIEQYWINTIDPWYNVIMTVNQYYKTTRPSKKPVIQYDSNGYFLKEYPSISAAAKGIKSTKNKVSGACNKKGTHKKFNWRFKNDEDYPLRIKVNLQKDPRAKSILQYSKKGEFLKEFSSLGSAARCVKGTAKGIRSSCKGKFLHRGFVWRYKEEKNFPTQISIHKRKRKKVNTGISVCKYSSEGIFIEEYTSQIEAERENNAVNLYNVCKNPYSTSGGFYWRYSSDVTVEGKILKKIDIIDYSRVILAYNMDGSFHKILNSRIDIERELGISHTSIINSKGDKLISRSHDYILFKYFDDYPNKIKPYRQNNQRTVEVTSLESGEKRKYNKLNDCIENEDISSATFQTYYKNNSIFTFKGHRFKVEWGDYKPFS